MKNILIFVLFLLAFSLQFGFFPAVSFLNDWGVNLVAILLLSISLFRPLGESFFLAFAVGLAFDALYFNLGGGLFFLIFPLLAFLNHFFLKKIWSGRLTILGFSLFAAVLVLVLNGLVFSFSFYKTDSFSLTSLLWGKQLFKMIFINTFLISPLFFFSFKRLNELFEYWEQKKRI
jgi:rod shape-determining protein MreD